MTPVIVALEAPRGTDPRELIDGVPVPSSVGPRRADVIVSGDPGALSYAAARPSVLMAALPWATTYVLVSAHAAPAAQPPPAADRNAIARDAVTAEARGAAEPFPWLTDTACVVAGATTPSATPRAIVAYPSGDATARQLAERVVALAGRSSQLYWLEAALGAGPMPTHVAPFPADSIATALATGRAAAAIIPVARDPRRHCTTAADARVPAGAIPLVDTRAHAIVRRGSGAAFLIALDGSLYFVRQRAR